MSDNLKIRQPLDGKKINVKASRLAHGLSQEELAFEAELDRTYISQIERGVSNPSVLVLLKISVILKVELSELFIKQS